MNKSNNASRGNYDSANVTPLQIVHNLNKNEGDNDKLQALKGKLIEFS